MATDATLTVTAAAKFTPDDLARVAHISDDEIRRDIADTKAEIEDMRARGPLLRALGDRMSVMRADAYISGIKEREAFIRKLCALLDARAIARVEAAWPHHEGAAS